MGKVIQLRTRTTTHHVTRPAAKAVAFYMAYEKLTPEHQRIETPAGPVYIRAQVTPATDLTDVFDHLTDFPTENFMNGHWVPEPNEDQRR